MKTSTLDFDRIKKTTDLKSVVESYGIVLKKTGEDDYTGLCPFHAEDGGSFHVSPRKNVFHCFGCRAAGNVIQFVARKEGVSEKEAAQKLLTSVPGVVRAVDLIAPEKEPINDPVLFASIGEHYHESLFSSDNRGVDYLKSRGLADLEMLKHFKVGFVNGSLKQKLSAAQIETAKGIGLLNKEGNEKFYLRIVVPIFDEQGQPMGLYGRRITDENPKHLYLAGDHRAVWNSEAAKVYSDDLILTESIFDALAFHRAGKKNVISSYGCGGWTSHHSELVRKCRVKKLSIAYDNDERGNEETAKLAEKLEGVACHRLTFPEGIKDANEFFLSGGDFSSLKTSVLSLSSLSAEALAKEDVVKNQPRLTLVEKSEQSALFKNGTVDYRVKGLSSHGMRLVLTAKSEEKHHTDHFDLYASKSRSVFSNRCAEKFGLEEKKIEEDLSALLEMLEKIKESEASPVVIAKPSMTEGEKADALALLRSPDLLKRVTADLEIIGYVGEKRNKPLAYIIATSRRLPKPLSGIFRSQSGAGKSFLMECVAEMMPPEDVHYFSRLTPQALYYLEPDALKHKLLIVDERNGSEESEYPIRTLQSRKVLKLAAPIKDPSTGKIKTVVLEIYGPIAYMESTTSEKINPENANRCFELYLDESDEQTRAVFAAQKRSRSLDGWRKERLRKQVLTVHHNAQRLLRSLKVIIPYVHLIDFPVAWLRGRRDHDRLLSLIEGVAFLHQHQRKISQDDGHEYIEASLEDYAIAYELAHQIFAQSGSDLPKPVHEFLQQVENIVCAEAKRRKTMVDEIWFTRRLIRESAKLPDHLIKRYMREIEELEYVEVKRSSHGCSFQYRLMPQKKTADVLSGLTTPENLTKNWNNWNKTGNQR
jgi:DNA primase catalytic core